MKALAGITLAIVLSTMFASLFHLASAMEMGGSMSDCPFMSHEEVICPMDLFDHLSMWKAAFIAALPQVKLLLLSVAFLAFVASAVPHLFVVQGLPIPMFLQRLRERVYSYSYRPLQDLFSRGILNPKLF